MKIKAGKDFLLRKRRGLMKFKEKILIISVLLFTTGIVIGGIASGQKSSMKIAVEEGKKYAGTTIVVPWEAGLQTQAPLAVAPTWEKLTGMKVKVVPMDIHALHDKQIADYLAGTGSYDIVTFTHTSMDDFIAAGLAEPLDPYIEKYMNKEDLEDILPIYREALMRRNGKWYALGDDGDVFILYYRKDLFEDPQNQMEFKAQYGYELKPPKTWEEFYDIEKFFTEKYAPDLYGAVLQRAPGQAYAWFVGAFAGNGGRYFNPETMEPEINKEAGIKTLKQMVEQNKYMPPGIETWGFMEVLNAWLAGKAAMVITWPPIGRWSEGYGTYTKQLAWVPKTKVAGKVGYMPMPGGRPTLSAAFSLGVNTLSKHKEAAYLFIQWWTSPEISLQVVMLPFTLRDPWRISHFESPLYRSAWANAGEYLDTLKEAALHGKWELGIPGGEEYIQALDQAVTAAYAGKDVKEALDEAARKWEAITNRLGREAQKKAYAEWLKIPGAGP